MPTQVENGKAFEWALAKELAQKCGVQVESSPVATFAESCFQRVSAGLRQRFETAARLSVAHILNREASHPAILSPRSVQILPDGRGQSGDVRDVILTSESTALGVSCKSNHAAFKHSRLSARLDFIKKWGMSTDGISSQYRQAIDPVFSMLKDLRLQSAATATWEQLPDVMTTVYKPILDAFSEELQRVAGTEAQESVRVANALLTYFIGNRDFYKVIARRDRVLLQAFNFQGTLAGRRSRPARTGLRIDDPEELNSRTVRIDRYLFNLRIHNASSRIEASLKFDIQAWALPTDEIYQHEISYS